MLRKILSLTLSISLLFQYSGFAQSINLSDYLSRMPNTVAMDRFRPLSLRYFSYEPSGDNFKILLDKGDQKDISDIKIKDEADRLLTYFKIGLSLPNEKFWVNLRPDAEDQIIDPELEKTDLGKALLEADLQLKKDTSSLTSPQSKEGKVYWEKLYKKAGELFGTENITIPTITRPWIVPGEIIVRESQDSAYIYKAVLKVMLEEDYLNQRTEELKNRRTESFSSSDPRLKELNKYSTELIKETILPELTKRINSSKDYASLRQVFFSLILARWFKDSFGQKSAEKVNNYVKLIDSQDLTNLTSKESWSKTAYFNEYQKSFNDGEYNLSEKIHTPGGQVIRRYTSGGMLDLMNGERHSYRPGTANYSIAAHRNMVEMDVAGNLNVGSPLVEDDKLAKGLSGKLNKDGVNLFGLIEKAFEGKGSEFDRSGHQRVVKFRTDINIAGVACKMLEVSRYQQTGKGNGVKYRTIEFFADESSSEYVLQIKVYNDGRIGARAPKTISDDERLIIAAVIRKIFKAESLIILEHLFEKTGLSHNLVENLIQNRMATKGVLTIIEPNGGYIYFDPAPRIEIGETKLNTVAVNKSPDRVTINIYDDRYNNVNYGNWISSRIYPDITEIFARLSDKLTDILPAMENANEIQIEAVNMALKALGQKHSDDYSKFSGRLLDALNATKSSSAMEASKETKDQAIISAVKSLQDKLPDDKNEQLLKFVVNVNSSGELEYPIKKDGPVMIGHVRGDRAWYLARGLQEIGFDKLLGYIKFNKDFKGVSVLPEEAVGKISNTFFEGISDLGYTSVKISEDEKKEHTGYNANGRNEQPFPGERRVVIKMQKSSKAYVDTPEMRMKEVADAVLAELDGNVDFILTNFLSSDMMKHTGSFESAKKSNEITDQQLGRIKERIDAIKEAVLEEMENEVNYRFKESEERIHLLRLLTDNYDKFLKMVSQKDKMAWYAIKSFEKQVPLFVITADHGASETGLKENPKESDTFHSANPVPYIIYDPLRKQKIPLKENKTIRNNAATLLQLLGEEVPKEYDESLLPVDYQGSKRRIAFAVLDGWGINPDQSYPYDAIRLADTPNYDWFVKNTSFTQLAAHGEVIGLRKMLSYEQGRHHLRGLQAGQTDIGHIHLFSGREVKQPLWYIDQLILGGLSNGVFDETKEEVKLLIRELNEVKEKGLKFHYIAVGSEGGVHDSPYHMYAFMRLAKKVGLGKDQFVIHFAADGRDVPTRTAHLYLEDVYKRIEEIGIGVVSVVFGRDMLVRKEGAEEITNRLIDVMSGENLKGDDVTLVENSSQGKTVTDSPFLEKKKYEFENLLAVILGAIKEIKPSKEIDKDLIMLDFKNADDTRREIDAILKGMDSVSDLNGLREKVHTAIVELLVYIDDAGRIDKAAGKLKELYASLNADILADRFYRAGLTKSKLEGVTPKDIKPIEIENDFPGLPSSYYVSRYHLLGAITVEGADYLVKIIHDEYKTDYKGGRRSHRIMELVPKDKSDTLEPLIRFRVFDDGIAAEISYAGHKEPKKKDSDEPAWKEAKRKAFSGLFNAKPQEVDRLQDFVVSEVRRVLTAASAVVTKAESPQTAMLDGVGGMDLTQMNMLIQPQGGFASSSLDFSLPELSKAEIEAFDLDKELELIQRMASSGIDPIDERLKKYLSVCFARGKVGKEIDDLKLCLEDVFIAQQLDARKTPDGYKEVIVIADTRRFVLKESRLAARYGERINLN